MIATFQVQLVSAVTSFKLCLLRNQRLPEGGLECRTELAWLQHRLLLTGHRAPDLCKCSYCLKGRCDEMLFSPWFPGSTSCFTSRRHQQIQNTYNDGYIRDFVIHVCQQCNLSCLQVGKSIHVSAKRLGLPCRVSAGVLS